MYHLVLLFAAVALLSCSCRSAAVHKQMKLLAEMNDHIESNVKSNSPASRQVKLTRRPGPRSLLAGRTLELVCEATGAPAPSIHWFRDNMPIYEYDKESNEVKDSNPASLARVVSTLLVSSAPDGTQYTCVAFSGHHSARAHTIVYNAVGTTEPSERTRLVPLAPRILRYSRMYADSMGGTTRLPCAARGHPQPTVRWTDAWGKPINNPRMKVLRSGELVVSPLQWGDMGDYICIATNMFGSAQVHTFLYPAKPNESDG